MPSLIEGSTNTSKPRIRSGVSLRAPVKVDVASRGPARPPGPPATARTGPSPTIVRRRSGKRGRSVAKTSSREAWFLTGSRRPTVPTRDPRALARASGGESSRRRESLGIHAAVQLPDSLRLDPHRVLEPPCDVLRHRHVAMNHRSAGAPDAQAPRVQPLRIRRLPAVLAVHAMADARQRSHPLHVDGAEVAGVDDRRPQPAQHAPHAPVGTRGPCPAACRARSPRRRGAECAREKTGLKPARQTMACR